jgi:hypothetical protein
MEEKDLVETMSFIKVNAYALTSIDTWRAPQKKQP